MVSKTLKTLVNSITTDLSWEELQALEKRRRKILRRQGRKSFFRILFSWDGTLLRMLSKDNLMRLTMGIYALVRCGAHLNLLPEVLNTIGGADIGIIGAFLSFFLVIFVNDSSSAFERLFEISMKVKNSILATASLARSSLPRSHAARLVRYLNAAHVAGYVGLSRTYTYHNFFAPLNEQNRLLTDKEIQRMQELDMDNEGICFREIVTWCMLEISTAERQKLIDPLCANQFRETILNVQTNFEELFDDADQPLSFAYYHFACFLSAVYLPLFAMSSALDAGIGDAAYWVTDVVSGFIVCLQAIFVVGLRVLAESLSAPYGANVDSLSVLHYITHTWEMSNRIIGAIERDIVDPKTEETMCLGACLQHKMRQEEIQEVNKEFIVEDGGTHHESTESSFNRSPHVTKSIVDVGQFYFK
eukprot:scaffold2102_cov161-Amphora_coffeaeformis.AAC.28